MTRGLGGGSGEAQPPSRAAHPSSQASSPARGQRLLARAGLGQRGLALCGVLAPAAAGGSSCPSCSTSPCRGLPLPARFSSNFTAFPDAWPRTQMTNCRRGKGQCSELGNDPTRSPPGSQTPWQVTAPRGKHWDQRCDSCPHVWHLQPLLRGPGGGWSQWFLAYASIPLPGCPG